MWLILPFIANIVIGEGALTSSERPWRNYCHRYNSKEILHHGLQLTCPLHYDNKCNDPIMDPHVAFKYRCQTVYPHDEKLSTVEIMNSSTLLGLLQHTDTYKRMWCLVTLFYAPTCPFSARIAPYFNALPKMYNSSIKFIALDATEFSKLNSRYGISGTPTVMLWVSGAAVARMEDRSLNDSGLMSFIYDWTDVSPVFGSIRSMDDPVHVEFDDRPDIFYLTLSLLVVYTVVLYFLRDRVFENVYVRSALAWISVRMDALSGYFAVGPRAEP
uniref:Thioredoxin domain-containing protein n=1 Tax=Angiostrongylus cantonensis TaxID=6313 RepID=A0A0K0DLY7_ANGCA